MPLIKPDFSDIQDEVMPGIYKCTVTKGEVLTWSSGTPYVRWQLETFGEDNTKNNGRKIYYKTNIVGKGAFMLQKLYKAATGKPLLGEFDTEELLGKKVEVTLVEGLKEGIPTGYTEVKSVKAIS